MKPADSCKGLSPPPPKPIALVLSQLGVCGRVFDWTAAAAEPTAKQQLLPSVRERQVLDGRQAASHGSTQVSRVAECPHRQAVQVNRLHQVRQQCPLEAQHAPPVRENEC